MDLQLVNTELTESRLYRNNAMGRRLTGEQVSRLLYLHTLAVYMLIQDGRTVKFARDYIRRTTSYGNYTLFRNTCTDLYALAYHVNDPDSRSLKLKQGADHLERLKFDDRLHHRMLKQLADGRLELMGSYLQRLYVQLRISDSRYGSWRREAVNWANLSRKRRQDILKQLGLEIHHTARGSELVPQLQRASSNSTLKKAASAAAGAYVGRQAADKLGKNKNLGAGLGAIAGYWAAK